jgi:tetratricopeptide (TPR) repeat protein
VDAAPGAIAEMIGKVETFGGDVVELGPGGLVAAFGLEAVEDAPVRAALAALAILKASERVKGDDRVAPRVSIVVHVARVLVSRHQGTATIDLEGKRTAWATIDALTAHDERDTIVVSEAAATFLERRFELVAADAGGADAVRFRRLVRRERTGFGLGGRPLTPFVGREGELRLVTDRLAGAERGQGQVVGIVGEPGAGKSRFAYEVTGVDATRDWRVLGCGGASYASTTPLLPIAHLLGRYFAIEDADGPSVIREKVTATLPSRHEELQSCLTPLLSLLDVPVDDPAWKHLDPAQRRRRIQDAIKRLLLVESRIQPLLLIVEDLHWIDGETQAVLDELVESLPTTRVLLLVTYRNEYQHGWGSKTYYSQLRLDALPPERAIDLLDALLGDDPGLEPLTRLLVHRGNPFFIEETARALVETGALVGERGAYRLSRPIQAIEVPPTVQAILAARIERLPAGDRRLLQTASVIGKDVPVALLHAVSDAGEDELQAALARLRAAEFLYETRLAPDAEYTFKHALTQEVTYDTLLADRRADLHARIVDAVERASGDRPGEHVERLAYHAERGALWDKAATYLHQAAVKDSARSANREAVSHLEGALVALGHRPESRETLELAVDLRLDLQNALYPLGELARIVARLREAEALARTLGDERRLAQVSVHMCHTLVLDGRPTEALSFGQSARALAESLGDRPLQVMGSLYLGEAHVVAGDHRRAEDRLLDVLRLLEGDLSREWLGMTGFPGVMARSYLAMIFADRGVFPRGIEHGQEGIRLAEALDHPYSLAAMCWALAYLHITRGDFGAAVPLLERGLTVSRDWDLSLSVARHTGSLGYAYTVSGRTAEGLSLLEQALAAFDAMGNRSARCVFLVYLGEAQALAGRLDDALESAVSALTLARDGGQRGYEAGALRLLGEVTGRRDSPQDAEAHYRDALALAEELGMRPLAAHCHLGLGKQARERLATALAMYREMDMPFWRERAETAMKC